MNPFRSRKKSHDGGGSESRSDTPDIPAVPAPSSRSRTFRRKKSQPEPKVELDMSTVLPSTDNFRTSLLMPNLSARFSMLRDQDDPNTKIGKANDDSVLFPKRVSRLNLFGGIDGLSDIAEAEPLPYPIRPPFVTERTASYSSTDGYGTDDDISQTGSVMSRAKPGQGNKFFGGRQKIYKIPLSASTLAKDDNGGGEQESRKGMGRAVYDDDVAASAWQALKDREREEKTTQEMYGQDQYNERESTDPRGSPPPSGYNRNRETSSSTTSGAFNARTSTAATSVASQSASSLYGANSPITTTPAKPSPLAISGLDRPLNKGKRMYGQGLDQQIYEQQSSALNRLESLQQRRVHSPALRSKGLSQSRSATGLNDRFQQTGPLYASNNFRAGSPPPPPITTGLSGFDLGLVAPKSAASGRDSPAVFGRSPSLSPPISPGHESSTFAASVAPNDVGKATASGAFHKPRAQYNEEQYAQRMLQLHEGRDTPPPRAPSSADAYSERSGRLRNDSGSSTQSPHTSKISYAASSMTDQGQEAVSSKPAKPKERPAPFNPDQHAHGTFLAGLSGDDSSHYDSSSERGPSPDLSNLQPATYQSLPKAAQDASDLSDQVHDNQHPAILVKDAWDEEDRTADSQNIADEVENNQSGLGAGTGLSGLIKTHLRNTSGQSSIYPSSPLPEREAPPELPKTDYFSRQADDQRHKAGIDDSKWIKRVNEASYPAQNNEESSTQTPLSFRAAQMRENASQLRNGPATAQDGTGVARFDKAEQFLGDEAAHHRQDSQVIPWHEQMKPQHARDGSTETKREREDFEHELADRRRRVQEKLQSFTESGSRSSSPRPFQNDRNDSPHRLPRLLKKVSKGALAGNTETSSKAMKMLGITGPNGMSPMSSNEGLSKDTGYEAWRDMNARSRMPLQASGFGQSSKPTATSGPSFRDRSIGADRRNKPKSNNPSPPSRGASPFAETTANFSQDDPMDPPVNYPNHPSNGAPVPSRSQLTRKYSPTKGPIYSPADRTLQQVQQPRSQSALSNRARSNSRDAAPGFFDQKLLVNTQSAYQNNYPAAVGNGPRASPIAPYTAHATSPLCDISPISTAPTMVSGPGYSSSPRAASARKRSVSKYDISEPTFVNSTSSVTTIDLPEGASLSNGMESSDFSKPPIPPINPRRKQSPGVFGAPAMRSEAFHHKFSPPKHHGQNGSPNGFQISQPAGADRYNASSDFSADDRNNRPRDQNRLRKMSSEGRNLAARARHQALMNGSPAVPSTTVSGIEGRGGMF